MKRLITLLFIGLVMSCGNSEETSKNGLTRKLTSKRKVETSEKVTSTDKILVYSVTGDWKVNYNGGDYEDKYCTYEIFYTETTNTYKLVMEGYQPKNHSAYEDISKLIINIQYDAREEGYSYKQIRLKYLQP